MSSNVTIRDQSENTNGDHFSISTNALVAEKKKSELKDCICMLAAEFVGTFCLLFFGCMGTLDWIQMPGLPISGPLNFGLTVMFIIQMFGHISYAIINPAVAIAAVVHKFISIKMGILFMIVEIIGATLGYGLLQLLTPDQFLPSNPGMCMTVPHPMITTSQAFFLEFFLTFALVLVISGVWDPRNRDYSDSIPLRVGLTVVALSLAGGTATGTSMNPARTFAPAIWNGEWKMHWVYWVAPMSGAFLSAIFYRAVFWRPNPKDLITEAQASNKASI